jgi:hypothetical protein
MEWWMWLVLLPLSLPWWVWLLLFLWWVGRGRIYR